MNDKWLNDIHDRMADYEADEPAGLWDKIEAAMPEECGKDSPASMRRGMPLWFKWTASVAAMLALVVSVAYFKTDHDLSTRRTAGMIAGTDIKADDRQTDDVPKGEPGDHARPADEEPSATLAAFVRGKVVSAKDVVAGIEGDGVVVNETEVGGPVLVAEERGDTTVAVADTMSGRRQVLPPRDRRDEPAADPFTGIAYMRRQHSDGSRFSVGAYTSGAFQSSISGGNSNFMGNAVSIGPDNAKWEDTPMLGILLYNQGRMVETEMKHRLPVRTGVTFNYRVSDRLTLGTGVTYANLVSDMKFGSDKHYLKGKQSLHYIGIPVNVMYRACSWKRLDVYASGGVLGEKCVDGKTERDFVLSNNNIGHESESIIDNPVQWSVNVSAGLQFNVSSLVGIYAEPGLGYYFDNGSAVETIYKDKPLNFNLNIGLRFTFGD